MNKITPLLAILACSMLSCAQAEVQLDLINLPEGFSIEIYAEGVEDSRQLALGHKGTVFAGSRKAGKVWVIRDTDGDQRADKVTMLLDGLKMPSGLEFRDGALYVGDVDRILRYDHIEERLDNPPEPVVVTDDLPDKSHHGWKYLRFGPGDKLYIPVGAPCNVCDEEGFAQIRRMNADGSNMEVYAEGVRNSVGIAFHPDNGELWFTDNGRDLLGDDIPADELNYAPKQGMHFGFPYCHQGDLPDEKYGKGKNCADYTPPVAKLDPHGAALGLAFYTGNMFPVEYEGKLFITQHGSWNRSEKSGYQIRMLTVQDDGTVLKNQVFASGWLQGQDDWGRPNDVMVMPDGALLVSDDSANVIYRIFYKK